MHEIAGFYSFSVFSMTNNLDFRRRASASIGGYVKVLVPLEFQFVICVYLCVSAAKYCL